LAPRQPGFKRMRHKLLWRSKLLLGQRYKALCLKYFFA
jgi:hypothetical protein